MSELESWAHDVIARCSATLKKAVEVEGLRNEHLGGRWEFARVKMRIEPATDFEVTSDLGDKAGSFSPVYLQASMLGLLDRVLTFESSPLRNIRVTILDIQEREIDSNPLGFRMAGRDAGERLLKPAREFTSRVPDPK